MGPLRNAETELTRSLPIEVYRLPSSSRAYPMSLDKKAAFYRDMFIHAGIIQSAI